MLPMLELAHPCFLGPVSTLTLKVLHPCLQLARGEHYCDQSDRAGEAVDWLSQPGAVRLGTWSPFTSAPEAAVPACSLPQPYTQ